MPVCWRRSRSTGFCTTGRGLASSLYHCQIVASHARGEFLMMVCRHRCSSPCACIQKPAILCSSQPTLVETGLQPLAWYWSHLMSGVLCSKCASDRDEQTRGCFAFDHIIAAVTDAGCYVRTYYDRACTAMVGCEFGRCHFPHQNTDSAGLSNHARCWSSES